MKRVKGSALRARRLRPAGRDAEPQVVGLAPQTTNERKTNTMKTYILRDPKTVEPQKSSPNPPPPEVSGRAIHGTLGSATPAGRCWSWTNGCNDGCPPPSLTPANLCSSSAWTSTTIRSQSSLAPSDSTEVRRCGIIGGEHDDVHKLVKKLQAAHGLLFEALSLPVSYESMPQEYRSIRSFDSIATDLALVA